MRAFADVLVEELMKEIENSVCDFVPVNACGKVDCTTCQNTVMSILANRLSKKYNNDWITDRNPTKEECKGWRGTFQATILQGSGDERYTTTVVLQYEYTTVRGKEASRWLFKERIAPWKPIAWKPLSEPYQL